jgi:(p)ppGpp synthase/HD superfamily hydrolase
MVDYKVKLINKILEFQKSGIGITCIKDISQISKAIDFAKFYHGDQKRDSGEPFFSHPLAVAKMVLYYCPKQDIIITAILHDVIEDTIATFETVKEAFGQKIAENVMDLTRIKEDGQKITSGEILERLFTAQKFDLLLVKVLDRIHNMESLEYKSEYKIKKSTKETIEKFIIATILLENLNLTKRFNELSEEKLSLIPCFQSYVIPFKDNFQLLSLTLQSDANQK